MCGRAVPGFAKASGGSVRLCGRAVPGFAKASGRPAGRHPEGSLQSGADTAVSPLKLDYGIQVFVKDNPEEKVGVF